MSISYTLRESFSGFRRAKISSLLSIITVCISLLLLGSFVAITVNAGRLVDALRARLEMEAFLVEPVTGGEIDSLVTAVSSLRGVEKVAFISKDDAVRIFKQEFGEDITTVLDFNPLPPSLKITLTPQYRTSTGTQEVYDRLVAMRGIESVVYRKALLELIDKRAAGLNKVMLTLGLIISLSAIFLVSNTIRLAIRAKQSLIHGTGGCNEGIHTASLPARGVGAGFVRRPSRRRSPRRPFGVRCPARLR
jgi:cell division transport system permease protein